MSGKRRLLVLDDEVLVAMMLEDMLADLDYDVVGPFGTLEQAMPAALSEQIDGAIIDLNLGRGILSTPVAQALRERGIPFLLATGYGASAETEGLGYTGLLSKPFSTGDVQAALESMFA
jgi:DNA-binding response OmpR family regulator